MQCVAQCLAHSTVVCSSPQTVSESKFGGLRLPSGKTNSKGRSLEDRPGSSYTAPYPLALEPQLASDQGHGELVHQPPGWGEASTGSPSQAAQGSQQASVEALVEPLCGKPRQRAVEPEQGRRGGRLCLERHVNMEQKGLNGLFTLAE